MSDHFVLPGVDFALRPIQSEALCEMKVANGLLGPIGVGHGKTAISYLAGVALDAQRVLVLVPASVRPQTVRDFELLARQVRSPRRVEVRSYAWLSNRDGAERLADLAPDLIVADEAHRLRDLKSARTRRLARYFRARPETRFVALSGTMSDNSVCDYGHLAELALREGSPVPRDRYELKAWARVLDPEAVPERSDWVEFRRVFNTGSQQSAREAFREAFRSTRGVVCTSSAGVNASLRIIGHDLDLGPELAELMEQSREVAPDGSEYLSDADRAATLRQLSLGFHYYWVWPNGPDFEWIEARNDWARHVRRFTTVRDIPRLDTPGKVEAAIRRGDPTIPGHVIRAFQVWEAVKDRPGPMTVARWVDDHPLETVLSLAQGPMLVWYRSKAVADRLEDLGLRVIRAGEPPPTHGRHTIALSGHSHHRGWNLQAWRRNLVLELPSSGQVWEQLIGRTHRAGQKADEVEVHVPTHTKELWKALVTARGRARYVEQTQGLTQRLCYADWIGHVPARSS